MAAYIPISRILRIADPVKSPPWGIRISCDEFLDMVCDAVSNGDFSEIPYSQIKDTATPTYHAERIAYLVVHCDQKPIDIDLGCGGRSDEWPIADGNHRLYAAVFRGDYEIAVEAQGACDLIEGLLGRECLLE